MKNTRTFLALLSVALFAYSVTDLMAQGRGGGGRPGGFGGPGGGPGGPGGFGGPGGGPGGFGGGDPTLGLLQIEEVRKELDMFPDQEQAVAKLREQAREAGRGGGGGVDLRGIRDASEEERQRMLARLAEQRQEAEKKMREQLEEILLPEQLDRLDQIALQTQGIRALQTEKVATELKITAAQKAKFDQVREEMGEKMRSAFGGGNRENMRAVMEEIQTENEKQMLAVLTTEQKSKFEEMKGEPFEMPARDRGAFGQRGGRGGEAEGRGGAGGRGGRGAGGRPGLDN